jgi:uncharacterized RDD family membrane protein YckC
MPNRYYVIQNGRQFGPFSITELTKLNFQQDNLIWTNGLPDWVPVSNMEEVYNKIEIAKNDLAELSTRLQNTRQNKTNNHEAILSGAKDVTFSGYKIASPARRLAACVLHWFIALLVLSICFTKARGGTSVFIMCVLSAISYFFWSGNIGHKILKLKVIKADTEADCKNPVVGFFREAIKLFCTFMIIPNVWLIFDEKKQNLYDKLFNTIVIETVKENKHDHI